MGSVQRLRELGEVINTARNCSGGVCVWDWSMVNNALNSAPAAACFEVMARIPSGGTGSGGGANPGPLSRTPYTRCEGMYPWLIYWNKGAGNFATAATVKYQPVPLESEGGDSNVSGPGVVSPHHMILDFDGDGDLDAVAHAKHIPGAGNNSSGWFVWLGDGLGGFSTKRYFFPTRVNGGALEANSMSRYAQVSGLSAIENTQGIIDMNGDGLPDHWLLVATPSVHANITFNYGDRMHTVSATPSLAGELDTTIKPGNEAAYTQTSFTGSTIFAGNTMSSYRTVDIDHDGRPDVVSNGVYWNMGGKFRTPAVTYPNTTSSNDGITRRAEAYVIGGSACETPSPPPGSQCSYDWKLLGDLIDVDGNGIAENYWIPPMNIWRLRRESFTGPPRTMTSISNGRGATTTIAYSQMHETGSTPTVTQSPTTFFTDSRCMAANPSVGCPKGPRMRMSIESRSKWIGEDRHDVGRHDLRFGCAPRTTLSGSSATSGVC